MPTSPLGLPQENLTLIKKDGTVHKSEIPASIGRGTITTFVISFPIEVGDHFLRKLPNGLVEDYIVDDPRYSNGVGPIPANYQIKVHRSDAPVSPPQTIIANFHGANSRVNVHSEDNSYNAVAYQSIDLKKLADELMYLREALAARGKSAEDYAAIGVIASAELAAKSGEQPKLSFIGAAGQWVLEIAKEIGTQMATEFIKRQLGL